MRPAIDNAGTTSERMITPDRAELAEIEVPRLDERVVRHDRDPRGATTRERLQLVVGMQIEPFLSPGRHDDRPLQRLVVSLTIERKLHGRRAPVVAESGRVRDDDD